MLTTTLLYDASAQANQVWTASSLGVYAEWLTVNPNTGQTSGSPVTWGNGDIAEFPALGGTLANPTDVAVSDAGATLVFASQIVFLSNPSGGTSYYDIKTSSPTSNDVLEIPAAPSGSTIGTTIDAQTGTFASIAVGIVSPGMSGGAAGDVQVTGAGSLTIAANTTAQINNLNVGQVSGDSATLDVAGTLQVAQGDTLDVANNTVLTGAGTINLPTGTTLDYRSSVTSDFSGIFTGSGTIEASGSPVSDGTLTLTGDSSQFSGAVTVDSGALKMGASATLGMGPLTVNGGVLDLGGSFSYSPASVTVTGGLIEDGKWRRRSCLSLLSKLGSFRRG